MVVPGMEPSVQGTKVCPATAGATNWPSPAYNPDSRYFYVLATEGCGIGFKQTDNFQRGGLSGFANSGTSYIESPEEQERWQMYVRALDVTTGKIMWEFKQVGGHHYGPGLVSTAGSLLFAGDAQGFLTAHDARTGKPLWHFSTGDILTASPIAYAAEGNEYIAQVSGANIIAFGLPEYK